MFLISRRVVVSCMVLCVAGVLAAEADQPSSMDALIQTEKFTEQPIPIRSILSSPGEYQLHLVVLQGTVRKINPSGTLFAKCGPVYDSYTFTLDDGTGAIQVSVAGACYHPGITIPVTEEEQLVAQVLIQVVGEHQEVRAIARSIVPSQQ